MDTVNSTNNRHKPEQALAVSEKAMSGLIILTVALLPVGRTVEYATILMAILGLVLVVNKKTRLETWSRASQMYALLFMLFWLPMAISLLSAVNFPKTLSHVVEYVRFFFAGLFVLFALKEEKIRDIVMTGLAVIVGFWLADTLIQRVYGVDLFARTPVMGRVSGPFKGLHMPIHLTLLLPMVLAHLRSRFKSYIFWLFFVLSLLVLFWAGSRASWIALLWGAFLYGVYVLKYSPKKPYAFLAVLVVSIGIVFTAAYHYDSSFKERMNRSLLAFDGSYKSVNVASSNRLPIWEAGARVFLDSPITGIGARGFRFVYQDFANKQNPFKNTLMPHPHLFVLEILVETGMIGFFAMIWALALIVKMGARSLPTANLVQVAAFITLCIAFFPLNTHVALYGGSYSQLAWLMTAIVLSYLFNTSALSRRGSIGPNVET